MQPEVSCGNWDPNTNKKNVKAWPHLPSDLDIHQVSSEKVWGTAPNQNAPTEHETTLQGEVGCGNWDPNTKKNNFKVWQRLPSDLDIHQVSSAKIWGTVSNRNALVRLETIISRHLLCATSAPSTPTKFFTAWSLRQWQFNMHYLNFSTLNIAYGIRILPPGSSLGPAHDVVET